MRPAIATPTTPARILIIGSGGREHALAWRLAADPGVDQVIVAPGNPGMRDVAGTRPDVKLHDHAAIVRLAANSTDLVVVGPEGPLADGLADALREAGVAVFGPDASAARLESSKAYCRGIAEAAGIPIPEGAAFSDPADALRFARSLGAPLVVKADGLAAGKGVTVCGSIGEAERAITDALIVGVFGSAGRNVVIERALEGPEASLIGITDGRSVVGLPPARDHKRLGDDDTGPNTGGMGAFSPIPDLTDHEATRLIDRFHRPLVAELARRGIEYRGALYAGLMLTARGPYLLECNARFGDPETQVLVPRIRDCLAPILAGAAAGGLAETATALGVRHGRLHGDGAAAGVVLAAAGYPESPGFGEPIDVEEAALGGARLFWSGVESAAGGQLVTSGGRIVSVVGRGASVAEAADAAYRAVDAVRFAGRHLRRDIGRRPVAAHAGAVA